MRLFYRNDYETYTYSFFLIILLRRFIDIILLFSLGNDFIDELIDYTLEYMLLANTPDYVRPFFVTRA